MLLKSKPLAKLTSKLSSPRQAVTGNSASTAAVSGNGWLTQGGENIAAQAANMILQSQKKFAPESYLKSGESKNIRFRTSVPLGQIFRYTIKNNGRFDRYTAPAEGETDLFRENGLRASFSALYEIIDIDGYVEKKTGKRKTMQARFFPVGIRLYEQLEHLRKVKGNLTSFTINIAKTGQKKSTSYALIPDVPKPLLGAERVPTIKNDIAKYYAPPSEAEQRSIFARFDPSAQSDD